MGMNKINNASLMQSQMLEKFQGTSRSDKAEKDGQTQANEATNAKNAAPADKADISDRARQLMDLRQAVDTGRMAMEALPDVRSEKMAEVRARMEKGYYNSTEVLDEVAEKIGKVIGNMDEL